MGKATGMMWHLEVPQNERWPEPLEYRVSGPFTPEGGEGSYINIAPIRGQGYPLALEGPATLAGGQGPPACA